MVTRLSIVVPAYNEAENICALISNIQASLKQCGEHDFEIIIVNDGSTDSSQEIITKARSEHSSIHYVRLASNFGSHAAIMAGLKLCNGEIAIAMAADLQDPPRVIQDLILEWKKGYNIVWACRESRQGESWLITAPSMIFYAIMNTVSSVKQFPKGADFFLIDRKAIQQLIQISIKDNSILMLVAWLNFRQSSIKYIKRPRNAGRSKWTFRKKVKLFVDSIRAFSGKDFEKRFRSAADCSGYEIAESSLEIK